MLFFSVILAAGVIALLGMQRLDIEGINPPKQKPVAVKRKTGARAPASQGMLGGAVYLRQQ